MRKLIFFLLLTLVMLAAPAALAEQTILSAVVPDEHTLTLLSADGGTVTVNGTALSAGSSVTLAHHERAVIDIRPDEGLVLDTAVISSDYGVSMQGDQIVIAQMVTDVTLTLSFKDAPLPDVVITAPLNDQTVTVYEGESTSMAVTAENAVRYQWFVDYGDGSGWHTCGTAQPFYITPAVSASSDGYRYKCAAYGANGSVDESVVFTLRVLREVEPPVTGDDTNIILLTAMLLSSTICLYLLKKRRQTNE